MGNNPSSNTKPNSASPAGSTHGTSSAPAARREPRLRDNIQSQRVAAPPEPSLAQARGFPISRTAHSQSPSQSQVRHAAQFGTPSPSSRNQSSAPSSQSSELPKVDPRDQPSKPVAVPIPASNTTVDSGSLKSPFSGSLEPSMQADAMSYHLTRPPRLPLPIEEEVHTPGSPIIAPADPDGDAPLLNIESIEAEGLPRQTSNISNTTVEDEEDGEELPIDKTKAVVPTNLEWHGGGEKVYVTGTIFQWSRKSKLYPDPSRPGTFSATISVRPGTHHIRFIVDGNMTISPDMPTTVDFGNNLVNYIEVSADDVPQEPSAVAAILETIDTPVLDEDKKLDAEPPKKESKVEDDEEMKRPSRTKPMLPQSRYTSKIPQYLLDLDKAEDSTAYQYAAAAIEKLPTPPSLPGFLGKPILNAATPMKDDNSVLNMPNHTVLNHLATSSIKNNVLAVSATTRYKRKYVTTIMYKPTTDDTA